MSTQPEPQTEAGRELLDRQSDPDWMDLDYAPKLAAILAIEQEATAAARAEVARQAVTYGYQRGQADERYGRGYRPEIAVANFHDAQQPPEVREPGR